MDKFHCIQKWNITHLKEPSLVLLSVLTWIYPYNNQVEIKIKKLQSET